MSVHVTAEAIQSTVTNKPVLILLNTNVKIEATHVQAWEIDNGVAYEINSHYEYFDKSTKVWIWVDEATIVDVTFPLGGDGGDTISWITDGTLFYYLQGGDIFNVDGSQYYGDATTFAPVITTTNNTAISESWTFSVAYEVNSQTFTYAPITKAVKITNTGTLVIQYYRGSVLITPELVEDVLPAAIYKTDSIRVESGATFDSREYPHVIAGISLALYQRRARRNRMGQMESAGNVACTWYNGPATRKTETWVRNEVINFNAEGGQESIEKDFAVTPNGGSEVEVRIRTVHFPIVSRTAPTPDDDQAAFNDLANTITQS